MGGLILDVRENDEFNAEHIENSINFPLSVFEAMATSIIPGSNGNKVFLISSRGKRAFLALELIAELGLMDMANFEIFEGGLEKWKDKGGTTLLKSA